MQLNDYQAETRSTAIYRERIEGHIGRLQYAVLGLTGEAGEVANLVKKIKRDDRGAIRPERREEILDEVGDVLWYVAAVCDELGCDLEWVASINLAKLQNRHGGTHE